MSESRRIRICLTHDGFALHGLFTCLGSILGGACDIRTYVESSDGSALLAITECEVCGGRGCRNCYEDKRANTTNAGHAPHQCPKCGGRGYEYQARVVNCNAGYGVSAAMAEDPVWVVPKQVAEVPL